MKLLLTLLAFAPSLILAETFFVNNDTAFPADYRTFDEAFAAAAAGDTIMLAPSPTSYGDLIITGKPVKVIGNGSTTDHPLLQPQRADIRSTITGRIYIGHTHYTVPPPDPVDAAASDGTLISGVVTTQGVVIWSDDCIFTNSKTFSTLTVWGDRNVISKSNIRGGLRFESHHDPVTQSTGSLVSNCIIPNQSGVNIESRCSATLTHCVIDFQTIDFAPKPDSEFSELGSAVLRHCIIAKNTINSGYESDGARLHNCLIAGETPASVPSHSIDNNNLTTTTENPVFLDGFQLAPDSPAIGAGENGIDLGIFGGSTPFEWGGVPAIPLIQDFHIISADPVNGLKFRVKATSRD
jgi:hypothetical protein